MTTITGTAAGEALTGTELDDLMTALEGNDTLTGGNGADTLSGGPGNDDLDGGGGANTYLFNPGDGNDVLQPQGGFGFADDRLQLGAGFSLAEVRLNWPGDSENLVISFTGHPGDSLTVYGHFIGAAFELQTLYFHDGATLDIRRSNLANTLYHPGNPYADTLEGFEGGDVMYGGDTEAADSLHGNGGDDLLDGQAGADYMEGGTGDDIYLVDQAGDAVVELAGQGTDVVRTQIAYTLPDNVEQLELLGNANVNATGNILANILTGNSGRNLLDGGAGADTLSGGGGDDTYVVDNAADSIVEGGGGGNDVVQSGLNWTLGSELEQLVLTGTALNGMGNGMANRLTGNSGHNLLDGGAGADTLVGGAGNDTFVVDNAGDAITESAGQGSDSVQSQVNWTLGANLENLVLTGVESLTGSGNALDNLMTGNAGSNGLDGGDGVDTVVYNGHWKDYVVSPGLGVITMVVTGALETDVLTNIERIRFNGVTLDLADAVNDAPVAAADGNAGDSLVEADPDTAGDAVAAGNLLTNDTDADLALGVGETLSLVAVNGVALAGGMTVSGRYGSLSVQGNGQYVYTLDNADPDTEALAQGQTVTESFTCTIADLHLATGISTLTLVIQGSSDEVAPFIPPLSVTPYADTRFDDVFTVREGWVAAIDANAGDVLQYGLTDGLAQADGWVVRAGRFGSLSIHSATGQYRYQPDDLAIEALGEPAEDVFGITVSDGGLTTVGDWVAHIHSDAATETPGHDVLTGTDGSDRLLGLAGDDLLDGGAGADSLLGGAGNDTYVVTAGDTVTELAGEGTDLVLSGISWTIRDNLENLELTGSAVINATGNTLGNRLTGNAGANTLYGGSGNDTLDGGAGGDTLVGGSGDDTLRLDTVADVIVEYYLDGTDTVIVGYGDYLLGNHLENLVLDGTASIKGGGNNASNHITGNAGHNLLSGSKGNDTLIGGTGNDTLDGGTGSDSLAGGAGDDLYQVDGAADVVLEEADQGIDVVSSSINWTLGAHLERLVLTGALNLNGGGNALDNLVTGNSGANVLYGGAGNDALDGGTGTDTLYGGAGNDTYLLDQAGDLVTEYYAAGIDSVRAGYGSYTLGNHLENLTLTGTGDFNGTGNSLSNVLYGNGGANRLEGLGGNDQLYGLAGHDWLDGGQGDDVLTGGSGNDTYVIDAANDLIVEYYNDGLDTVVASLAWTLGNHLEQLTLTGTLNLNGTGNTLHNVLTGNSGANVLTGGRGNDTYAASRGMGADTIVENDTTAGNSDVLSFAAGVAHDQLWFRHVGNDLEVSIIGTGDLATIRDWYSGAAMQVERIVTVDGAKTLQSTAVESLVNAMASLTPPPLGQTTLDASQHAALDTVIAANWS